MITLEDARDRVARIWADRHIDAVYARQDGDGFDIALNVLEPPIVRGRDFWYHHLNTDGHAVCHADCVELERDRL